MTTEEPITTPETDVTEEIIKNVPSVTCLKKAIWSAIKTKTNFETSPYLYTYCSQDVPESEAANINKTFGPWTDGIWFRGNFSLIDAKSVAKNEHKEYPTQIQYSLDQLYTGDIPEKKIDETGTEEPGITKKFITDNLKPSLTEIRINNEFIDGIKQTDTTTVKINHCKVFEASSLATYLMYLQNRISSDSRVDRFVQDVYATTETTIPKPEDISSESIIARNNSYYSAIFGTTGATIPEKFNADGLYKTVFGENGESGLKADINAVKLDLYGTGGLPSDPKTNSIKALSIKTIQENGILMEATDYVYLKEAPTGTDKTFYSNYFDDEDTKGFKLGYEIVDSTKNVKVWSSVKGSTTLINTRDEDSYPYLLKVVLQYTDSSGNIVNETFTTV